ncbi:MAG: hypothetical protein L6R39_003062 [Caloplaca ligustica]|nr:MAG: hypothetical protein L6R39_003062 [Caloplaca ligustica]
MEGDDHQRPQYEHQQYASGYPQNLRPNVRGSSGAERFGQAQMMSGRGPTSASVGSMTGAQHQEVGNYGYAQGSQYQPAQVQSSSLHFPATYQPDLQRSQNVPQYTSQVAYNVPQQQQPRSPYDPMPQYQPRQSAALEVLSNQFGVPQYYPGGEPIGVAAQTSPAQQYAPSHFQQSLPYQAPGIGRGPASTAYPSGMAEYPHSSMQEMVEHPQPETSSHDEEYQKYQEAVRQVFEDASRGRLVEAAQSLLEISEWLRGHAKDLGMLATFALPKGSD